MQGTSRKVTPMGNKSEFKEITCMFDISFVYLCTTFVAWLFNHAVAETRGKVDPQRMREYVYHTVPQKVYKPHRKIIMSENGIHNYE